MSRRRSWPVVLVPFGLLAAAAPVAAQPPNDAFGTPTVVPSLPFDETSNTAEASVEPGEPQPSCGSSVGKTVWFSFTPAANTVVVAVTGGSDFDTVLSVWTGDSLGTLAEKRCNDDWFDTDSRVAFLAQAGITYRMQVGGSDGAGGSLRFRIRAVESAGVISGRVVEEGTGVPLDDICVDAYEEDFPDAFFTATDPQGRFEMIVRPGAYRVFFYDECDDVNDHRDEWYQEASSAAAAAIVSVSLNGEASGIDGTLTLTCPFYGWFEGPQLMGTSGPDTFVGSSGREVICTFGGKDRIRALGGNDEILAGAEDDVIKAGGGNDDVLAEAGKDLINAGGGNDDVFGETGSDTLLGLAGNDRLAGGSGPDDLRGGSGKDNCIGGGEKDRARSCEEVHLIP